MRDKRPAAKRNRDRHVGLRVHESMARRGELDCHDRVHPRAAPLWAVASGDPILIIEIIAVQAPSFSRRGRLMLVKVVDQRDVPAGLVQLWVEEPTSIR
jgi:hypothetical protein